MTPESKPRNVLCIRCADVPPTKVVPPDARVLRCARCEAKVYVAPSTAKHVEEGLMRPLCNRCGPTDQILAQRTGKILAAMTTEQLADLVRTTNPETN